MPKKLENKEYFIKGKQEITDAAAPVISNEFIDTTNDYTGQTIEVQSDTKLEEDQGEGGVAAMKAFEFAANPLIFQHGIPSPQDVFNSHIRGIEAMLWQDGLEPVVEMEPRLIFASDRSKYLILVWARPQRGQFMLERNMINRAQTLSEIVKNETRSNSDQVHGGVQLPTAKKKKTGRAA